MAINNATTNGNDSSFANSIDNTRLGSQAKTKPKKLSVARNSKGRHSSYSSATMFLVNTEFLDDIKTTIERFDVEKAGKLETKQLKFAMRSHGFEPKKVEIKSISKSTTRTATLHRRTLSA